MSLLLTISPSENIWNSKANPGHSKGYEGETVSTLEKSIETSSSGIMALYKENRIWHYFQIWLDHNREEDNALLYSNSCYVVNQRNTLFGWIIKLDILFCQTDGNVDSSSTIEYVLINWQDHIYLSNLLLLYIHTYNSKIQNTYPC